MYRKFEIFEKPGTFHVLIRGCLFSHFKIIIEILYFLKPDSQSQIQHNEYTQSATVPINMTQAKVVQNSQNKHTSSHFDDEDHHVNHNGHLHNHHHHHHSHLHHHHHHHSNNNNNEIENDDAGEYYEDGEEEEEDEEYSSTIKENSNFVQHCEALIGIHGEIKSSSSSSTSSSSSSSSGSSGSSSISVNSSESSSPNANTATATATTTPVTANGKNKKSKSRNKRNKKKMFKEESPSGLVNTNVIKSNCSVQSAAESAEAQNKYAQPTSGAMLDLEESSPEQRHHLDNYMKGTH